MRDEMKEELNGVLLKWMGKYDVSVDSNFSQHLVDLMCDAVDVVYTTAVKMHLFLMGE